MSLICIPIQSIANIYCFQSAPVLTMVLVIMYSENNGHENNLNKKAIKNDDENSLAKK